MSNQSSRYRRVPIPRWSLRAEISARELARECYRPFVRTEVAR